MGFLVYTSIYVRMDYTLHIQNSIDATLRGESRLDDYARTIHGMSSIKVRSLLNFLLNIPDARYLEIGVWKGSTFYSALVNNNPTYAIAIDNWSEFGGPFTEFEQNLKVLPSTVQRTFYSGDCFDPTVKNKIDKKFNIYFYDGGHSLDQQRQALTEYIHCMDNDFIYICDDWNWPNVIQGTYQGISQSNLQIVKEWTLPADFNGDTQNWWNGLWVAQLRKI